LPLTLLLHYNRYYCNYYYMRTGCDLVLAVAVRDLVEDRAQRHEAGHRVEDHEDDLVEGGLEFVITQAREEMKGVGYLLSKRRELDVAWVGVHYATWDNQWSDSGAGIL
jgi:hypothetical protein